MATIKLFLGEQDGVEFEGLEIHPPPLIWVPSYEAKKRMDELDLEGPELDVEVAEMDGFLPYVLMAATFDETGEDILKYEFCEDILIYEDDPSAEPLL